VTPDQLISAVAMIVEDCCGPAIHKRPEEVAITPDEWAELDIRWKQLRVMKDDSMRRKGKESAR
jgi:hypothetical protein